MAYDKIITLKGRMDHCIDYVLNEEKTSLSNVLTYTENPDKTHQLVTALNCQPDTALADMMATKRRWDKRGSVLGYHIIHSYAPGEATPEEAHAAGVEFAARLLGDRYEVVVSTHLDREHLHCHIVFNSVSFVDGKKYRSDFKSYFGDLRETSNEVSRERGLSVIKPEGHGGHYAEWNAERKGRTTIRDLVRQDIDVAIRDSFTYDSFHAILQRRGYTFKSGPNVKYTALRPPGGERFFRLDSLGDGYTEDDILSRLSRVRSGETPAEAAPSRVPDPPKRYHIRKGNIWTRRHRPRTLRGLYIYYLYLLNPDRRKRHTPSFAVRKEVTKLQRYQRQFQFLREYRIDDTEQFAMLGDALQAEIDALVSDRAQLYERRREGYDVAGSIEAINTELRQLRRKLNTHRQITEDIPRIQGQIQRERSQGDTGTVRQRTQDKTKKEDRGKWM